MRVALKHNTFLFQMYMQLTELFSESIDCTVVLTDLWSLYIS